MAYVPDLSDVFVQGGIPPQVARDLEARLEGMVSGVGNKYPAAVNPDVLVSSWAGGVYLNGGNNVGVTDYGVIDSGAAASIAGGRVTYTFATPIAPPGGVFRGLRIKVRGNGRAGLQPFPTTVILHSSVTDFAIAKIWLPADPYNQVIDIPRDAFDDVRANHNLDTSALTQIKIIHDATFGIEGFTAATASDICILGEVGFIPAARAKVILRFDDSLIDLIRPGATFLANGKTRAWSCYELLAEYGFVGAAFILTSRVGKGRIGSAGKEYASWGDLRRLRDLGWEICFQSHYDPLSADSLGVSLLGPVGYTRPAISALAANVLTTATNHNMGAPPDFFTPVVFFGAAPPTGVTANGTTVYFARKVDATRFTLHPTEVDASDNTNIIALSGGTIGQYGYRHAWSTNDYTGILTDYKTGIAKMREAGFVDTALFYAPNQGVTDALTRQACDEVGFRLISGTNGLSPTFRVWPAYFGAVPAHGNGGRASFPGVTTIPSTLTTDAVAVTETIARRWVQDLIRMGGIATVTHHFLTPTNGPVLVALLDELRSNAASIDVVLPSDAVKYLAQAA